MAMTYGRCIAAILFSCFNWTYSHIKVNFFPSLLDYIVRAMKYVYLESDLMSIDDLKKGGEPFRDTFHLCCSFFLCRATTWLVLLQRAHQQWRCQSWPADARHTPASLKRPARVPESAARLRITPALLQDRVTAEACVLWPVRRRGTNNTAWNIWFVPFHKSSPAPSLSSAPSVFLHRFASPGPFKAIPTTTRLWCRHTAISAFFTTCKTIWIFHFTHSNQDLEEL